MLSIQNFQKFIEQARISDEKGIHFEIKSTCQNIRLIGIPSTAMICKAIAKIAKKRLTV